MTFAAPATYLRGCYGAPSVYQASGITCKSCSNYALCGSAVLETIGHVQAQVDASDYVIAHRNEMIEAGETEALPLPEERQVPIVERKAPVRKVKYVLTGEQRAICDALPKKAAKVLDTMIRNGKLEAMLTLPKKGINPFRGGTPNWMEVAFDELLAGGFSKKGLKESLMTRLQWGETTAFPHVTKVVAILTALGVIREDAGRFVLNE